MTWTLAETSRHQDHVIAHVIGATPLGHFIHDETAYILLDIGFIWNIYLDMEMGLVPQRLAIDELDADAQKKSELRAYVDHLSQQTGANPIESIELFEDGEERRLLLNLEQGAWAVETSLSHRWIRVHPWLN